jgi:putative SOS response-associated peptidase YedK
MEDKSDGMRVEVMRWGMLQPKTKDLVINGRFEDLPKRAMFRNLLQDCWCVITIDGYYEWYDPEQTKKNT